jgi:hypothetical protein
MMFENMVGIDTILVLSFQPPATEVRANVTKSTKVDRKVCLSAIIN